MSDMVQVFQLLGSRNPLVYVERDSCSHADRREHFAFGRPTRLRARLLMWLVIAGLALLLLFPQAGELRQGLSVIGEIGWVWLLAGLLASALT